MKYSQWNDLLFEYYFLEDKGHQVFLGLDKDTLVDYVIDKGCFNDVVDRVQQATPNRVIKPEEYIWNDFLRIFRDKNGTSTKDSLLALFKEKLNSSASISEIPSVFPFIALFTIPLANNPEMDPRNFYDRVNPFLQKYLLIKKSETLGSGDMSRFTRPTLKTMWDNLATWAKAEGFLYSVKASTDSGYKYVGPFMAESLLTATQRDKFKYVFYYAGLTPEQELSDSRIASILNAHHKHIGYTDDLAWSKLFVTYQDIFVSEFKRQYERWDGNTLIRQRSGSHKMNADIGSFKKLYLHLIIFRGRYVFSLIPRFNDTEVGSEYSYTDADHNQYRFTISVDGLANAPYSPHGLEQKVSKGEQIALKDDTNSRNYLKFVNEEYFLLEQHYSAFVSGAKLKLGGKYHILIAKDSLPGFTDWLIANGATEVQTQHALSSRYSLFFIPQVASAFSNHSSLDCTERVSASVVGTFIIDKDKDAITLYRGLPICYQIEGVNVSTDHIVAVFDIGIRRETRELSYNEENGLWVLSPITSSILTDAPFTLFCNDVQISSQQYRASEFKQLADNEFQEISFDKWGNYLDGDSDSALVKGLSVNAVHSTAFILGEHMSRFGKEPVIPKVDYHAQDYLLYWLSSRPRTDKQAFKDALSVLLFKNPDDIKYKITSVLDNYFRLGYINFAYHEGKYILAVNKPSLVLIPSGATIEHIGGTMTKMECTDKKWKVLLTGARTPEFINKLLRQAGNFNHNGERLKIQIDEAISPLYPQRILFWANSKEVFRAFAQKYDLVYQPSIYADTLLKALGSVQDYMEQTLNACKLHDRSYEGINDRRVLDYVKLATIMETNGFIKYESGVTTEFSEDGSVVTYYPTKYNEQTVLWYKGEQYNVDKYWGFFIGAALSNAKITRVDEDKTHIQLPRSIKLPVLYARALTMMSASIPDNQNGRRFYQLCENPFANALSWDKILEKLNQKQ